MNVTEAPYRGRFAPSPTGPLHFGSLIAAVGSFLQARSRGGVWLVRVDDIDPPREVAGAARDILAMLSHYGMESDEPVLFQSTRWEAYQQALEDLEAAGQIYACGCSRADLTGHGVYPGTCRQGLPADREPRSLRVRVPDAAVNVDDAVQGTFTQRLANQVGDFVVRRADSLIAYHLACVVDDAAQGITEVCRGQDLLESTPRQVFLQRLLDLDTPAYVHLPVVRGEDGHKLSKQTRAAPVDRESRRPTLLTALEFLGQPVPAAARRGSFDALWRWALEHWDLAGVPTYNCLEPAGLGTPPSDSPELSDSKEQRP